MKAPLLNRHLLGQARRVVVKVGSSSLTLPDGSLNWTQLTHLTSVLSAARERGQQVVLVSSGAAAAGAPALGLTGRPREIHIYQAACMVGQSRLMAAYEHEFLKAGITIGQILLTVEDVVNRRQYSNAQSALRTLLGLGVIPIVNENDAVATDEHRFGDNDRLAALTAHLVDADALILLTDVDGLYTAPPKYSQARLITEVNSRKDLESLEITGRGSDVGTGGMRTKVDAAELASSGGVPVLLTSAENVGTAFESGNVGTWFNPTGRRSSARRLWLEHAAQVRGQIIVDDGAAAALRKRGVSLLPVGVAAVAGRFGPGDMVEIRDMTGHAIARGLSGFSSEELVRIAGDRDGAQGMKPVVHVNDLVRLS
ncbi:glutamate 5-kinase [Changpingibacter yushuensis]|uniref:glutamate 5-kinase n=1 Tax=Changpingibacter yushuensis TaxID=2758440 RepID=UPI0015F694CD|nr:glutamate 5-kinase [Changpingibacter yushuensis]